MHCRLRSPLSAISRGIAFNAVYRLYIEDLHYGRFCRVASIFNVILFGLAVGLPVALISPIAVYECWKPTFGDDGSHPGYVGADKRLKTPLRVSPDGLCLYRCLVAAADFPRYIAATDWQRSMWAERLRCKTIALLKSYGLTVQARRLALSGSAGYPDEPDFYYLAEAVNLGFEVCQDGLPAPLPYGGRPITATLHYRKVADGAGHLSDHYDLQQVHYDRDLVGRRLRLWRKTTPQFAMFGSGKPAAMDTYVKERDLKHHRSTIIAAITKYPSTRAQALVTVLSPEYDLTVKWKALQNYVLR